MKAKPSIGLATLCALFFSAADAGLAKDTKTLSILDREPAEFTALEGKVKYLRKGCVLYEDNEVKLKVRPKQLSATRYIMGPFQGADAECTMSGVALAIGLFDIHNQGQTQQVKKFFEDNQWHEVSEIPEFALYFANGADRMGRVFWKEIQAGGKLSMPVGTILCFRYGR